MPPESAPKRKHLLPVTATNALPQAQRDWECPASCWITRVTASDQVIRHRTSPRHPAFVALTQTALREKVEQLGIH